MQHLRQPMLRCIGAITFRPILTTSTRTFGCNTIACNSKTELCSQPGRHRTRIVREPAGGRMWGRARGVRQLDSGMIEFERHVRIAMEDYWRCRRFCDGQSLQVVTVTRRLLPLLALKSKVGDSEAVFFCFPL